MKKSKIAMLILFAAAAFSLNPAARAYTITPGIGPSYQYDFTGSNVTFSQGPFDLNCDLRLSGYFTQVGTYLEFHVTDGEASGGAIGLCPTITFGFPWVVPIPDTTAITDNIPLNLTFNGVDVSGPFGQCGTGNDSVPAVFEYVNPTAKPYSTFTFNTSIGMCQLSGSISEGVQDLLITNP